MTDLDQGTTEAPAVDDFHGASDDALLDAAKTAGEAAPPEVVESPPPAPPAPDADDETELTKLRKAREKLAHEQSARERLRQELRDELEREISARAPKRETLEEEARRQWLEAFRRDPVAAFKATGVDGAEAVKRLADAASPEGKLHGEIADLRAAVARLTGEDNPVQKELTEIKRELAAEREQYNQYLRQAEEQTLVSQVEAASQTHPVLRAYFDDDKTLVKRAREITDDYCNLKGEKTCPFPVIVSELRAEAKRSAPEEIKRLKARIEKLSSLLPESAGVTASSAESDRRQTGTRTLTAKGSSERRATPTSAEEMTDEERDRAALEAARQALKGVAKGRRTISD